MTTTYATKTLAKRAAKEAGITDYDLVCNKDGSWSYSTTLATITMDGGGVSDPMDLNKALADAEEIASDGIATTVKTHPEDKTVKTFGKPEKRTKAPAKAAKPAKAEKEPVSKAPKAEKPAKSTKPAKASEPQSKFDIVRELASRKNGVTSAELKAATGWENAGWHTIMKSAAKKSGLTLKFGQVQAEGSKRMLTTFMLV